MQNRLWQQVAATVVALAFGHSAFAAVVIVSQERTVEVHADVNNQSESDTRTAPDAGPFQGTASVDLSGGEFFSRASSIMNSTIGEDGITFGGALSYEVQDNRLDQPDPPASSARATVELTHIIEFSLDRAYNFNLTSTDEVLDEDPGAIADTVSMFTGEDGEVATSSGTLEAGTYTLTYATRVEGIATNPEERTFARELSLSLDLSPVGGGGNGGGPNPIPLPPGVWAGGAMLGAMALGKARRALRR